MNREIEFRVWDRKCMSLSMFGSSVLAFGLKLQDVDFRLGFNEYDLIINNKLINLLDMSILNHIFKASRKYIFRFWRPFPNQFGHGSGIQSVLLGYYLIKPTKKRLARN